MRKDVGTVFFYRRQPTTMLAVIRTRTPVLPSSRLPVRPRRLSPLGAMAAAFVLLGAMGHPTTARAGSLVVEVVPVNTNVTVPPGFAGTLELDLLNPSTNTQSFNVAGFQFELQVPAGSGVLFTNATTSTAAATYIFAGNSIADSLFGGSLIVSPPPPPPTNDLLGFDTVATSNSSTTLSPGNSFGLGLISFTADASAAPGIVPVSIIPFDINTAPNGTLISDNQGVSIPFTTSDGTITIGAGNVVPEPASIISGLTALLILAGFHRVHRVRRSRHCQVKIRGFASLGIFLIFRSRRMVFNATSNSENSRMM